MSENRLYSKISGLNIVDRLSNSKIDFIERFGGITGFGICRWPPIGCSFQPTCIMDRLSGGHRYVESYSKYRCGTASHAGVSQDKVLPRQPFQEFGDDELLI